MACGGLAKRSPRVGRTPRGGQFYLVRAGDTIWQIARMWRVPVQDIAEWNNVQDPNVIRAGQKLYIPGAKKTPGASRSSAAAVVRRGSGENDTIRLYHGRFQWPVEGPVHSQFGIRGDRRHDGIDIGARAGMPIHAAADGVVAYSSTLSGYGHLLILKHPEKYYSAYAHNARNLVKVGQRVRQGEVIARVGSTGHATGPHLHFEIRHGQKARNPLFFLPVRGMAVAKKS
ncbi:MAG: peptidoglycan DD-metalloendopeptidase family protein [Deltaproteobacteria bacterium]|nr:peptidoglycan DD-metalloendopeptidase family protein [Deltaproteobacteria bacterium]